MNLLEYEAMQFNRDAELMNSLGVIVTGRSLDANKYTFYSDRLRDMLDGGKRARAQQEAAQKSGSDILEDTKAQLRARIARQRG